MLEIRHLNTLVTLREAGSVVEAADRLCVTQSALSHQLKELESRLGCELFVRKTRPLNFTEQGRRLLLLAQSVLAQVDDAERDLQKMRYGETGRLFMAIECHSCFNWLMPTVNVYRSHWPEVELDFSGGFVFEPLPALVAGEVDMVITSDPMSLKGVCYQPLFVYEAQIALGNDHPLASKPYLQPEDLRDQTLITYPVDTARLDVFKHFLKPAGVTPSAVRKTELTLMMVQLVVSGLGLCALPNWALHEYVEQGLIQVKSASRAGIWPTLYTAIREEDSEKAYMKNFIATARKHCLAELAGVKHANLTASALQSD